MFSTLAIVNRPVGYACLFRKEGDAGSKKKGDAEGDDMKKDVSNALSHKLVILLSSVYCHFIQFERILVVDE